MFPPGIEIGPEFAELSRFGDEHAWQDLPPKKDFTNAFVFSSNKVLRKTLGPVHVLNRFPGAPWCEKARFRRRIVRIFYSYSRMGLDVPQMERIRRQGRSRRNIPGGS